MKTVISSVKLVDRQYLGELFDTSHIAKILSDSSLVSSRGCGISNLKYRCSPIMAVTYNSIVGSASIEARKKLQVIAVILTSP